MVLFSLRKGLRSIAWACLAAGGLAGVGGCNPTDADTVTITEQNADSIIALRIGQTLRVMLESNPSTGCGWEPDSFDSAILEQQRGIEFIPGSAAAGITGAPGTSCITFQAVRAGQTALRLIYHRPTGVDTSAAETFEVTVVVGGG